MVDLDEIKRQHSILDILHRLELTPHERWNGRSDFTINCPIPAHVDRTPSCRVHVDTGRFHCFGCGAHEDIFDLAQQVAGLRTFAEAIQWMNERRPEHIASVRATPTSDYPVTSTSRARVLEMKARAWEVLVTPAHLAVARQYLMSRGIDVVSLDDLQEGRQVGYTPAARHGLTAELQADGCSETELVGSGWSVATRSG
ncbi:CHC2 zinc finger domain-containing protein [uncultured Jatrophihabitans sp.]|uniref:CHC2 zinc finger domain-containing protein n=1 Tax=uncultured Jatrophihabitans sp. TaxID=1610747 RepID=UPI0035CAF5D9